MTRDDFPVTQSARRYEGEPLPTAMRDAQGRLAGSVFDAYEMDLDAVAHKLNARPDTKLVALQFPDGLRDYATSVETLLREKCPGIEFVISADPTYGACDIALSLQRLGVDVLVHFGHTEMPSIAHLYNWDVIFIAARHKAPVGDVAVKAARHLAAKLGKPEAGLRVGLVTTAQHAHKLDEMATALRATGFEPLVGWGDNRLGGPGQLLGCNFTAGTSIEADVDGFAYVGSGDFHPIAIQFGTKKPVALADPYTGEVRTIEDVMDRLMRQRYAAIARAQEAKSFGILVGTRVGQERMKLAFGLKKLLEQQGKDAHVIALDFFNWDNLQYFRHLGALVNTSCPRITTDDYSRYPMPMLTPQELEIVLGRRTWEAYAFDEFKGTKPAPKGAQRIAIGSGRA